MASCTSSRPTWSNSRGDDPCAVVQDLGQICDSSFSLPALVSGQAYYPLSDPDENCMCNVVAYNLMQACQWCQGPGLYRTWELYNANCTTTALQPSSTSGVDIPAWAVLDTRSSGFSLDIPNGGSTNTPLAGATGSTPNTAGSSSRTSTRSRTSSYDYGYTYTFTSGGRTFTSTYTLFSGDGPTGGSSFGGSGGTIDVGSVVGIACGIVGGVILLTWVIPGIVLACWLKRRKREMGAIGGSGAMSQYNNSGADSVPILSTYSGSPAPPPMPQHQYGAAPMNYQHTPEPQEGGHGGGGYYNAVPVGTPQYYTPPPAQH